MTWYPWPWSHCGQGPKAEPEHLLPKEQGSHPQLPSDTRLTAQNQDPGQGEGEYPGDIIWLQIKALCQHRLSRNEGGC